MNQLLKPSLAALAWMAFALLASRIVTHDHSLIPGLVIGTGGIIAAVIFSRRI